jgi:hypothetical protein
MVRYLELLETQTEEDIRRILKEYFIIRGKITINSDDSVDIGNSCKLRKKAGVSQLPIKFNRIGENFYCQNCNLISLVNSPKYVGGKFQCFNNLLESLIGAPDYVGGDFLCGFNPLKSLEGCPKEIGGTLVCFWNPGLPLLRTLVAKGGVEIYSENGGGISHPTSRIINKYRGHTNFRKAVLDCQRALREAGYVGNAEW